MVGMVLHFGVGHLDIGHKPGRGALGLRGVMYQTHIYHGRWTFMVVWRGETEGEREGKSEHWATPGVGIRSGSELRAFLAIAFFLCVCGWVLVEKIPIYPSLEEIEHDRPNMFFFSFGSLILLVRKIPKVLI